MQRLGNEKVISMGRKSGPLAVLGGWIVALQLGTPLAGDWPSPEILEKKASLKEVQ